MCGDEHDVEATVVRVIVCGDEHDVEATVVSVRVIRTTISYNIKIVYMKKYKNLNETCNF